MAALLNDGSLPYGAPTTATINSVTYIVESCTPKDAAQKIDRRNNLNEPTGRVLVQDFIEAALTLQLATTSTALPPLGTVFTADLLRAGSNQNWAVMERSPSYKQDEAHKVDIEAYQKIN